MTFKPILTFIQLTDLHYTSQRVNSNDWVVFKQRLLKGLRRAKADVKAPIDILFFTGDLSFSGLREDLLEVSDFLTKLKRELSYEKLVVLPGNHDIIRADPKDLILDSILTKMEKYQEVDLSKDMVAKAFIKKAYASYARVFRGKSYLIPGNQRHDFTFVKEGFPLQIGVQTCNFGYLNLSKGDHTGDRLKDKLCFPSGHLEEGFDDWVASKHAAIVSSHEPLYWLRQNDRNRVRSLFDRTAMHLCGHEHFDHGLYRRQDDSLWSFCGEPLYGDFGGDNSSGFTVFQILIDEKGALFSNKAIYKISQVGDESFYNAQSGDLEYPWYSKCMLPTGERQANELQQLFSVLPSKPNERQSASSIGSVSPYINDKYARMIRLAQDGKYTLEEFEVDAHDIAQLQGLTAKDSVLTAFHFATYEDFIQNQYQTSYSDFLATLQRAAERGTSVKRLFIVDRQEQLVDPAVREHILACKAAGITFRFATRSLWKIHLDGALDVVVYGGISVGVLSSVETSTRASGPTPSRNIWTYYAFGGPEGNTPAQDWEQRLELAFNEAVEFEGLDAHIRGYLGDEQVGT